MNTPLAIGALIVAIVVLLGMLSVIKTTLKTALTVAVIVFALQMLTGIGPQQVLDQLVAWAGGIGEWLQKWGGTYTPRKELPSPRSSSVPNFYLLYIQTGLAVVGLVG
jgi:hypothetical protein